MKRLLVLNCFFAFFLAHSPCWSQVQSSTNTNEGSRSTFSYRIESTYGVRTTADASPNFRTENEAILKLKSGSFVTNKFGNDDGSASAVFMATPTGGSVDLQGIAAKNLLLIDDGTYFRSILKSVDNPDPNLPTQASASALGVHSSSITVEKGDTSFSQSFTSSF